MKPVRAVRVGPITVGRGPLALIAGPDVIESEASCLRHAEAIGRAAEAAGLPLIFKCSFDKANRTSLKGYRGPGLKKGLAILNKVKRRLGLPVLSDVHCVDQVKPAAEVLDCIQVPAFLSRQTDLLLAVGRSGRAINVKKGQFLAPHDMKSVIEKLESAGARKILLTERGTTYGYNYLVNDMRALGVMRKFGYPVVFDAGHSTQLPGGLKHRSGGQPEFIPLLARAAVAAGCDALFVEVHENPAKALCDGPSSLGLKKLPAMLRELVAIRKALGQR
ncbi:MAG: 3-deoxy-8-phosphooctulonate synthase [Candidatus Omnitrophica bacterium CG11_big_fil_rev_8_21_14_0_20_64_10]|nr:MAG: 3-deoxy-8-phosphooctulonate synthase [Candidatus Omnitrophica bacterium CG11_big_fil_rev_8_21_14_0_20_64_10]